MLIFIFGDDTFRVQEKVRLLSDAFKSKFDPTGMNYVEFPARDDGKIVVGEVRQAVSSAPFMGDKRMVVIRDLARDMKKDDEKVWLEGLSKTPDSTIVILWESMGPKEISKKKLYKELSKEATTHQYPFPALEGYNLQKWVQERITMRGGSSDTQAMRELIDRVGTDLWQMDNEISKLAAYGEGGRITKEMVEELVRPSFEGEIFALIDAVSKKQTAQALKLLQQERWAGANDFYLMSMLARQIRILLAARSMMDDNPGTTKEDLAGEMSIHPFVASKALQQARLFTLEDLKRTHQLLYEFDRDSKRGMVTSDLAVDLLVTDLIK